MKCKIRCQRLDSDGNQCKSRTTKKYTYHGDNVIYGDIDKEKDISYVVVYLCNKHKEIVRGD